MAPKRNTVNPSIMDNTVRDLCIKVGYDEAMHQYHYNDIQVFFETLLMDCQAVAVFLKEAIWQEIEESNGQ